MLTELVDDILVFGFNVDSGPYPSLRNLAPSLLPNLCPVYSLQPVVTDSKLLAYKGIALVSIWMRLYGFEDDER